MGIGYGRERDVDGRNVQQLPAMVPILEECVFLKHRWMGNGDRREREVEDRNLPTVAHGSTHS